jgi:hypothetical protein
MHKLKKDFDSTATWEAFAAACKKIEPNIDFSDVFLSLRDSAEYLENYFDRNRISKMIKMGQIRSNENKKAYKADLTRLKIFLEINRILLEKGLQIEETVKFTKKKIVIMYEPSPDTTAGEMLNDRQIQSLLEYIDLPFVKEFLKLYKENKAANK